MRTSTGSIAEPYMMLDMSRHWGSYYKWPQKGSWFWLGLARQFLSLALQLVKEDVVYLAIDNILMLSASTKAPDSHIYQQHSNKSNLAPYVHS